MKAEQRGSADGIPVYCSFERIAPIESIVPNPRNPNRHGKDQLELMAKIISGQGWRSPITISKRSGFIVRGHGRLEAAKRLGVKEVPIDTQDYATEAEELADMVADNRLAELATVDLNELEKIASEWKAVDFDTILAGFEPADLESLLNPDGGDDDDDEDDRHDKELDKSDVTVAVGLYRFRITQDEFIAWCDRVKQDAGFDKESVLNEIRSRLGL